MEAAPLGLVAGEGIFPLLVARGAKAAGRSLARFIFCPAALGVIWRCDARGINGNGAVLLWWLSPLSLLEPL
jgi:DUF1009 family protein